MGDTSKQFSLQGFRPEGFQFPVGLNGANTGVAQVDTITTTPSPGNYNFPAVARTGSTAEVLVVGGGGGGGQNLGGGGGAGGLVYHSSYPVTAGASVTCTIGSRGLPQPGASGTSGSNTVFGSITAIGGGGGGQAENGKPGGSGGGGSYYGGDGVPGIQGPSGGGTGYGNAGHRGSGYNPANNTGNYSLGGGGGGGAGGNAVSHPLSAPDAPYRTAPGVPVGSGGVGLAYSISGSPVYYAIGGSAQFQTHTGDRRNATPASYGTGGNSQNGGTDNAFDGAVIVKYYVNDYSIN